MMQNPNSTYGSTRYSLKKMLIRQNDFEKIENNEPITGIVRVVKNPFVRRIFNFAPQNCSKQFSDIYFRSPCLFLTISSHTNANEKNEGRYKL